MFSTLDLENLDTKKLESIVATTAGIDTLLKLRGKEGATVLNLIDKVLQVLPFVSARALIPQLTNTGSTTFIRRLGGYLCKLFDKTGRIENIEEAIVYGRKYLALSPPGHADRPSSLQNLSIFLSKHFDEACHIQEIYEVIKYAREWLALCPPSHPNRAALLQNLSVYLSKRYEKTGRVDEIGEAVDCVSILPGLLRDLCLHLSSRFIKKESMAELDEEIQFLGELLEVVPLNHKWHAETFDNLVGKLRHRYSKASGLGV